MLVPASSLAPLPGREWMWWPVFLWIQFGSRTDGSILTSLTEDACIHSLLTIPLSLTSIVQAIMQWLHIETSEVQPTSETRTALRQWMNANQWTTSENEFYMARIYHLAHRNILVVGGPRFQRAESDVLTTLVQTCRPSAVSVYAFALLIRNGEWPVTSIRNMIVTGHLKCSECYQ